MSGVSVDPAALADTGPKWGAQAADMQAIFERLTGQLYAEGDAWGHDLAGRMFAEKYLGPALQALQQMDNVSPGLQSLVDGVATWAKSYLAADQQLREALIKELGP